MTTVTEGQFPGVRPLTVGDVPACAELARDRGWSHGPDTWRVMLEVGDGLGIDDSGGGLAGTVIVTRFGTDLAVIGMLLVATRHGRRGLGRALMEHALGQLPGRVVFLYATPLGRPLYERLDFRTAGAIVKHVGAYQPDTALAGPSVRPPGPADRSAVLQLDRAVFGADRSAVLAALGVAADQVVVAEDRRGLVGHAAAWRTDGVLTIGPVVARDDAAARALVQALAAGQAAPVRVDLPARSPSLSAWAGERGMIPASPTPLMVHRGRALPGARDQLYAPATLALG